MLSKALQAAAGNAGEALFVDSVFSSYLYTGNGSTQTITNGIDLAGEGGLVWIKKRDSNIANTGHILEDTERGANYFISTNSTNAQSYEPQNFTFNSNGFGMNVNNLTMNYASSTYASWTFRKAEKFFDVVTYTGNGVAGRQISHALGSIPGCIIIKRLNGTSNWPTYHRSLSNPNNNAVLLNLTNDALGAGFWSNTAPTDSVFTVSTDADVNGNGNTYVAYLFAHDAGGFGDDGSENVISCGSFTANANTTVNLGFEPQWIMIKNANAAYNWGIFDVMRGWTADGNIANLKPNLSDAETQESAVIKPTATGFQWIPSVSGNTYIYIAIRRPMKPPSVGTEVYQADFRYSAASQAQNPKLMFYSGFPVDATIYANTGGFAGITRSRLTGGNFLFTTSTDAEYSSSTDWFGSNLGLYPGGTGALESNILSWMFRRAPGFMDVVCYSGTSATNAQTHNLGVTPEWVITKSRSGTFNWFVYVPALNINIRLNDVLAGTTSGGQVSVSSTAVTFSAASGNSWNGSGYTYVAYLFASCPGVSKVGSYTGNGSSQTINCGFTGGARFVLIKATSTTGNWIVADSARGINGSTDPALYLNSTSAEVTGFDWIDADSSGFIVNETATIAANTNGVSYIFLAVS